MRVAIVGGKLQGVEATYLAHKAGWETIVIDKDRDVPASGLSDQFAQLDVTEERELTHILKRVDLLIPALENDIVPQEGYRLFKNYGFYKVNGGCLIIASVSAEKMRSLMLALVRRIGSVVSLSFEDYFSDEKNVIDYLSYDREIYFVENLLDQYWRLIQNSYDVQMSVFSGRP